VVFVSVESNIVVSDAAEAESAVIVVDNYSLGNKVLEAGKEVEIVFTLKNTSYSASASSIILTMSNSSGMLNPKYGSGNQIYVGNIEPAGTKDVSVLVAVNSKFNADFADITCKLDYVSLGLQKTNSVTVVIPSSGGSAISVNSINVSARATINSKSLVSINYINNSGKDISGAELVIDGNVTDECKNMTLGTISAGKNYSKDLYVVFTESGVQQASIKMVYPSENGDIKEIDLGTYSVNVAVAAENTNTSNIIDPIVIWAGRGVAFLALLAAVLTLIIYIKKK
jgi:hypothetical protein